MFILQEPVEAFLLWPTVGWCNERAGCGDFKEWFPAAHHSYPPVKGLLSLFLFFYLAFSSSRRFIGPVFTPWPFRTDLFREEERNLRGVSKKNDRPTSRQITHLSGWRQNKGSRHGIVSCKKSCQDFAPNSVTPFHPPSTLRDGTIPDRLWFVEPVYPKRKLFGKII